MFRTIFFLVILLVIAMTFSSPSHAQVKLSDRKTTAFKESKKNKNKKQRRRARLYKKSARENLTQGETNLVPEALKQQNLPAHQNAQRHISKTLMNIEKKQQRIVARKTRQALQQGIHMSLAGKSRQKIVRKQSRIIARDQGDIPFVPEALKEKPVSAQNPKIETNPGKSNLKTRNQKLAAYAEKSEEAQGQGFINGRSFQQRMQSEKKSSRKQSLSQGKLNNQRSDKNAEYMAKSVEAQNQGTIKGRARRGHDQVMQSNSMAQSQFQGNLKYNTRQKTDEYMAKSVESQNQGLMKGTSRKKQQIAQVEKSVEAQSQGMYRTRSKKAQDRLLRRNSSIVSNDQGNLKANRNDKQTEYLLKSSEAQGQGMVKGLSAKERNQQLMSNSLIQSGYQGNIKAVNPKAAGKGYARKSREALNSGLIRGLTPEQKEAGYLVKSAEGLGQGLTMKYNRGNIEANYIRKSQEALDQGKVKGMSKKEKDQELFSNSIIQTQYQGKIKGKSKKTKDQELFSNSVVQTQFQGNINSLTRKQQDRNYQNKSKENSKADLVSTLNTRQKSDQYLYKSLEGLNQGLSVKFSPRNKESQYIHKSQEALDQGKMKGKTKKESDQELMSNSVIQSFYQGELKTHGKNEMNSLYTKKSHQAQKAGMINALTVQQKDAGYMAKSVEGLSQGLIQGYSPRDKESMYIKKSQEALDQGKIKGKSQKEKNEELQFSSASQAFYQGNIKGNLKHKRESNYIRKSQEALNTGLISGVTIQQKEAGYMAKSVEALNQGMIKGRSVKDTESKYIRKSMEASNQGLIKGNFLSARQHKMKSNSLRQTMFQGNLIASNKANLTARYIRQAIDIEHAGLMKGVSAKSSINEMKKKAAEDYSYQGENKTYTGAFAIIKDIKERHNEAKTLKLPQNFKVRTKLFNNIYNVLLSMQQSDYKIRKEGNIQHWWAFIWKKPLDQHKGPPPLRKPRYDPHERAIWDY